jgi:hypothetical protein
VRGKRVETKVLANVRVKADALQIGTPVVAVFIAVPLLLILILIVLISSGIRRSHKKRRTMAFNEVLR